MDLGIFNEILSELKEQTKLLKQLNNVSSLSETSYVSEKIGLEALMDSKDWPEAVDPEVICYLDNEEQQKLRAESVVEMMIDDFLKDLKFLDFGCGNGYIVSESLKQEPKFAIGYDIKEDPTWKKFNANFTTNLDEVRAQAPYDVILIYDVLDHILEPNNPADALKIARDLLHPNGKIYLRCHPFCSRTGTHLYYDKNKAFLHLVFSEIELLRMGFNSIPVRKVIHPMMVYQGWIREAELKENYNNVLRENVEDFFEKNSEVATRIKSNWKSSHEPILRDGIAFPRAQMEMQWVDFVLHK